VHNCLGLLAIPSVSDEHLFTPNNDYWHTGSAAATFVYELLVLP
jgi:hypothetical protein